MFSLENNVEVVSEVTIKMDVPFSRIDRRFELRDHIAKGLLVEAIAMDRPYFHLLVWQLGKASFDSERLKNFQNRFILKALDDKLARVIERAERL